jgi:hypothetical protein
MTNIPNLQSSPAIVSVAQQALSSGCGVGGALSQINSAIRQASTAVNSAIATANDIISAVQNLPNIITAQVSSVISTAITNALGPVRELNALANQIQSEVARLLQLVNNPAAFLAQYLNIQNLFPNLDLNGLLNQILSGLNICQATANATSTPAAHPPSNQQAQPAPEPTPNPQPPESTPIANLSYQSQITREPLPPPPGVAEAPQLTPAQERATEDRRIEIIRLNVLEGTLSRQRFWSNDEQERIDLARQLQETRERRNQLSQQ